jgi:hypothetical protein
MVDDTVKSSMKNRGTIRNDSTELAEVHRDPREYSVVSKRSNYAFITLELRNFSS